MQIGINLPPGQGYDYGSQEVKGDTRQKLFGSLAETSFSIPRVE